MIDETSFLQNLRLGEAQRAQLVKWHEGHVKQLKGMRDGQSALAHEVHCSLHPHILHKLLHGMHLQGYRILTR